MKKDIHPKSKEVTLVMGNNIEFKTMSTYDKSNRIVLDVYFMNHAAWSGKRNEVNTSDAAVSKFNEKFGNDMSNFSLRKKNNT